MPHRADVALWVGPDVEFVVGPDPQPPPTSPSPRSDSNSITSNGLESCLKWPSFTSATYRVPQSSITGNSHGSDCYRLERPVAGRESLKISAFLRRTKIAGPRPRSHESTQHPAANGLAGPREDGDSPCLIALTSLFG